MHRTTALLLSILSGLFALAGRAEAGTVNVDAELAYKHDDNLGRAQSGRDIFSDNAVSLDLSLAWNQQLSANSGLRLSGGLGVTEQSRFDELSHVNMGAGIRYRIQPVAGYTSPWIELGGNFMRQVYRDSKIRDGNIWTADAMIGKRFTDRIGGRIGLGQEWRHADDDDVFDWQRHRIFAAATYRIGLDTVLYANFSRTFGDQVFTATPNQYYRIDAKAYIDDLAFGPRRAYRLGAVSNTIEGGFYLPLSASSTLDVGLRHFHADADGGHSYDDNELHLSWLYRFR